MEPTEDDEDDMGIAECIIDMQKKSVVVQVGTVDDVAAISEDLASEVQRKARTLLVLLEEEEKKEAPAVPRGHGQVGFLRQNKTQTSPGGTQHYSVVPVTAKHNLRRVKRISDGKFFKSYDAQVAVPGSMMYRIYFDDMGNQDEFNVKKHLSLRENVDDSSAALWKFGVDVSKGKMINEAISGLSGLADSFDEVRSTFQCERGQKVGITVLFSEDSKPNKKTIQGVGGPVQAATEGIIAEIYGAPNVPHVYTGTITYVGEKHIEYTINSFTSCSGAIVFLLDKDQPASVQDCDFGKAIAVHGGAHPTLSNRNVGFLLRVT